eukprot:COSAG06_NODE_1899_length_8112_cov_7.981904_1_plen_80_part_10
MEELRQLRSKAPVASIAAGTVLQHGEELPLYGKAGGNASDAMVTFQLPKVRSRAEHATRIRGRLFLLLHCCSCCCSAEYI